MALRRYRWDAAAESFQLTGLRLPEARATPLRLDGSAGLRFHDVNGDGWEDVVLGNEVTEAPGAEQCFATTYVVRRFADAEGVSGFLVSPGLCGSSESQVEGQQRGGILPLPPGLGRLAVHHARTAGGRAWAPARFPHDGAARPRNSRYFS